eukprot:COSAG01_NODE_17185_length_1172_cov_1.099720_2_plen_54_part_00
MQVVTYRELAEEERPGGPPEAVRALDLRSFWRMEPCPGVSDLEIHFVTGSGAT